jgi:transcriptional regulator with XRE-family HTH domain
VNEDEVYSALAAATEGYGGVVRFARRTGIGRTYVSRMLSGSQRVSVAVAGRLGFELRWVRRNSRNTEESLAEIASKYAITLDEKDRAKYFTEIVTALKESEAHNG